MPNPITSTSVPSVSGDALETAAAAHQESQPDAIPVAAETNPSLYLLPSGNQMNGDWICKSELTSYFRDGKLFHENITMVCRPMDAGEEPVVPIGIPQLSPDIFNFTPMSPTAIEAQPHSWDVFTPIAPDVAE